MGELRIHVTRSSDSVSSGLHLEAETAVEGASDPAERLFDDVEELVEDRADVVVHRD